MAVALLKQCESTLLLLLKVNPSNDDWKGALADVHVRLATAEVEAGNANVSPALATTGLATLKELATKHANTVLVLEQEVSGLLSVKPVSLRDLRLAIIVAEHEASLTNRQEPGVLLSLAQAYRLVGQLEHAHAAALEGLALLARNSSGQPPPSRTGRLLELEKQQDRVIN
jgi:hypothetical protein